MRYFPQLETRTAGQYPLRRERHERVVRHESLDGRLRSYYDPQGARVRWTLEYEGLTDGERERIDALFAECEGRLESFLFLDPAANLLKWSEDFEEGVWTVDPGIGLTTGRPDPWETTGATKVQNSSPTNQAISQTIAAPGQHHYCLSLFASGASTLLTLRIDAGGVVMERTVRTKPEWHRYTFAAQPGTAAETVKFSVIVPPQSQVEITGIQAEAQPAAGGYRRTNSRSGVYLQARFAEDRLAWTQQAPNNNAAAIRIESRP